MQYTCPLRPHAHVPLNVRCAVAGYARDDLANGALGQALRCTEKYSRQIRLPGEMVS